MVTLIGNKKATDMAYDLIKEVIDEVHFLPPLKPVGFFWLGLFVVMDDILGHCEALIVQMF
jgi:hypothetical protein